MVKKKNPYRIEPPFSISFSGGRSSGYMLYHILDAYDGKLPDDGHVLFANTGKECEESLEFVRDCGEQWGVKIHWLEYDSESLGDMLEVDFVSASRNGEPFKQMLKDHPILPNPTRRICTHHLKIQLMNYFMRKKHGYEDWDEVIGIRADEPARVAKMRQSSANAKHSIVFPLVGAGVTKMRHIIPFWEKHEFNLRLPDNGAGRTLAGNCDLCFLKNDRILKRLMREQPARADWWIEAENFVRQKARKRGVKKMYLVSFKLDSTYAELKRKALAEENLMIITDADVGISCFCGD